MTSWVRTQFYRLSAAVPPISGAPGPGPWPPAPRPRSRQVDRFQNPQPCVTIVVTPPSGEEVIGYQTDNPLIVQGDHTILVEVASPRYADARDQLVRFAELVKAPEHVHTYRVTPLSVWNACAAGVSAAEITA